MISHVHTNKHTNTTCISTLDSLLKLSSKCRKNKQKTITKTNNTKKTSKILFLFKWPFPGRQDLFCSFSNSHTQRLSCFLVAGLDEWAIVVSESRFLTFENKVSVKPKHKKMLCDFFNSA